MPARRALLLVNVGTPNSVSTKDVRLFLREFLSDPFVLDVSSLLRMFLVYFVITPFRAPKTAQLYKKIWTQSGSPLFLHMQSFCEQLQLLLPQKYKVVWAMRYGRPSLNSVLDQIEKEGIEEIDLVPLYPQYSLAATETVFQKIRKISRGFHFRVLKDFYNKDFFLDSFVHQIRPYLEKKFDKVIFSYHGLPERQIKKLDRSKLHCLKSPHCCEVQCSFNEECYRHQCFETTRLISEKLGLTNDQVETAFQSRLGRDPWIQPFTDKLYLELPQRGCKRVLVVCPSFVMDCLETLEEVGFRGREQFLEAGGEELQLIPCLNSNAFWVKEFATFVRAHFNV